MVLSKPDEDMKFLHFEATVGIFSFLHPISVWTELGTPTNFVLVATALPSGISDGDFTTQVGERRESKDDCKVATVA